MLLLVVNVACSPQSSSLPLQQNLPVSRLQPARSWANRLSLFQIFSAGVVFREPAEPILGLLNHRGRS